MTYKSQSIFIGLFERNLCLGETKLPSSGSYKYSTDQTFAQTYSFKMYV